MHSAPAVSFPVGRSRFHGALLTAAVLLSAATLITWTVWADAVRLSHIAGLALGLMVSLIAFVSWLRVSEGVLAWDGQIWTWRCGTDAIVVTFDVAFDAQKALLLCLEVDGRPSTWLWPEQRLLPSRWMAFRRAVFAPQPADKKRDALWVGT